MIIQKTPISFISTLAISVCSIFLPITAMAGRFSHGHTHTRAKSQAHATFDPRNYRAAINRDHVPGDNDIHTALQALFCGTKRVYLGSEADLSDINNEEWQQIEQNNITFFIAKPHEDTATTHPLILCTQDYCDRARALALLDIIEAEATYKTLEDSMSTAADEQTREALAQQLETLGDTFCLNNSYLLGRLLDYPEDDIRYFYERSHRMGLMDDSVSFEEDKQAAEQFLTALNLTLLSATSSDSAQ
jgi:hypothetical protein